MSVLHYANHSHFRFVFLPRYALKKKLAFKYAVEKSCLRLIKWWLLFTLCRMHTTAKHTYQSQLRAPGATWCALHKSWSTGCCLVGINGMCTGIYFRFFFALRNKYKICIKKKALETGKSRIIKTFWPCSMFMRHWTPVSMQRWSVSTVTQNCAHWYSLESSSVNTAFMKSIAYEEPRKRNARNLREVIISIPSIEWHTFGVHSHSYFYFLNLYVALLELDFIFMTIYDLHKAWIFRCINRTISPQWLMPNVEFLRSLLLVAFFIEIIYYLPLANLVNSNTSFFSFGMIKSRSCVTDVYPNRCALQRPSSRQWPLTSKSILYGSAATAYVDKINE